MMNKKDPMKQYQGALSKAKGQYFEECIEKSLGYYRAKGLALIEKTPEPMRPSKSLGNGKFIAFYEKKAQPDYKGTVAGGKSIVFEAKFTAAGRMEQSRVLPTQGESLNRHQRLGALCYVIAGFGTAVYKIPWDTWKNMKEIYGRKYVTQADLASYRVGTEKNGVLLLLDSKKGEVI